MIVNKKIKNLSFGIKLFFSYFIFALALTISLTYIHIQYSNSQREERFLTQAKELLLGKITLIKEYVLSGSSSKKIPWLLEHLHSSEAFNSWCINERGNYLILNNSLKWSKDKISQEILNLNEISIKNIKDEFLIDFSKNIIILPLKALESPSGIVYMLYSSREKKETESLSQNSEMIIVMILMMLSLSAPFAYILSKPLNRGYRDIYNQSKLLEKKSKNLTLEIERSAKQLAKKDRLLNHQSKLASIGEMIGNISHQWRLPLTRVQLIMQNVYLSYTNNSLTKESFNLSKNQMKEQIKFMSETIDVFQNFYKKSEDKESCEVEIVIQNIIKIAGSILTQKEISLKLDIKPNIECRGSKQELGHILLNLISNAKYELVKRKISNPWIKISAKKENSNTIIEIEDNAGGIEKKNINSIFEPYFSTKEDGTGLGLYMSKLMIEDTFGGEISVKNSKNGALFKIEIKKFTRREKIS